MLGTDTLSSRVAALLGADTVSLANPTRVEAILIAAPFTPSPTLTPADITEATFAGYAPIACDTVSLSVALDPATGDWVIRLPDPVGGFNWKTSGTTNLPQTIYGKAVTNAAGTVIYGSELFETDNQPTLSAINQFVLGGDMTFRIQEGSIT